MRPANAPQWVYNTLTRSKETFVPRETGKVYMYVCGPTVYNYVHIGNARTFLSFDVIRRYLRYRGYDLIDAQNFTDVDDKIINRAAEEGIAPEEVARKYEAAYLEDTGWLGIEPARFTPRATEFIPKMIEMISALVEKGHAYAVEGDVYFSVESFPDYGKLSKRTLEEMRAGERVEVDPRKRHPMDFALWKAARPGEPFWDSPWGPGRPGWHIECSAMSHHYLGMGFDIHGGAQDLIFPHHENEVAQAEGATGEEPFVRTWLHAGLLNLDREKMSKSIGNILPLRDLRKDWHPDHVRLMCLGTHYRQPLDFSLEGLEAARSALSGLQAPLRVEPAVGNAALLPGPEREAFLGRVEEARDRFLSAMDDDFNTGAALAALHDMCGELNDFLGRLVKMEGGPSQEDVGAAGEARGTYVSLARDVFGLKLEPPVTRVVPINVQVADGAKVVDTVEATRRQTAEATAYAVKAPTDENTTQLLASLDQSTEPAKADILVEQLVGMRNAARQNKNFALADRIRSELADRGYILEDTPQGTRYYSAVHR